jgi:cytidyltransferase-like protein
MSTVLTLGTFDLLHPGHVHLFETCRRIAGNGEVHVAVNPDEFVAEFKGRTPVQSFVERARMVGACRAVDEVHATPGADATPLIDALEPDFVVIGKDWAARDYHAQLGAGAAWFDERDIVIVYVERVGDLSSTLLKARVRDAS